MCKHFCPFIQTNISPREIELSLYQAPGNAESKNNLFHAPAASTSSPILNLSLGAVCPYHNCQMMQEQEQPSENPSSAQMSGLTTLDHTIPGKPTTAAGQKQVTIRLGAASYKTQ